MASGSGLPGLIMSLSTYWEPFELKGILQTMGSRSREGAGGPTMGWSGRGTAGFEPRRSTQCSTHARKGGRFGAGVKGVGAIDLDGMDHMAGAKGHHRRSNAAWHGATCDALAAINLGLE